MFYTRQGLEKQTQRWVLLPCFQASVPATQSCLLFDQSVWICISIPRGPGLGPVSSGAGQGSWESVLGLRVMVEGLCKRVGLAC